MSNIDAKQDTVTITRKTEAEARHDWLMSNCYEGSYIWLAACRYYGVIKPDEPTPLERFTTETGVTIPPGAEDTVAAALAWREGV